MLDVFYAIAGVVGIAGWLTVLWLYYLMWRDDCFEITSFCLGLYGITGMILPVGVAYEHFFVIGG